jgi:GxxExxY protein
MFRDEHQAQLLNYLKATKVEVGILLNFGATPEFKRLIYTNDRKKLKQ